MFCWMLSSCLIEYGQAPYLVSLLLPVQRTLISMPLAQEAQEGTDWKPLMEAPVVVVEIFRCREFISAGHYDVFFEYNGNLI